MDTRQALKDSRGFSLIELMISLLIFSLAMSAIYQLLNSNTKSYSSQENIVTRNQDLRAALAFMVREIRMAGCDPTAKGDIGFKDDTGVTSGNGTDLNSIRFELDITDTAGTGDPDGKTDNPDEDINYYITTISGVQVLARRTADGDEQALAENVTALAFKYYNEAGTELTNNPEVSDTDLEDITTVELSITAETPKIDPILKTKRSKTVSSRIDIRNANL